MSAGPIKAERDARTGPVESNRNGKGTIHAPGAARSRTYCGKGVGVLLIDTGQDWLAVTCSDCLAAKRADQEAAR